MNDRARHLAWGSLLVLLLLVFLVGGALRHPAPRMLDSHVPLPENHIVALGEPILADCQFQTSWWQRPDGSLRLELPEGLAVAPGATPSFHTVGWGAVRWRLFLEFRAYRPGEMAAGQVEIPCGETSLVLPLPAFTVSAPATADATPEAAPLPPPPPPARWLGWVLLAAIAWFVWRYQRRRSRPAAPPADPPSGPSRSERLTALRDRVEKPDADLFGQFCDLVADHLHACHGVPATGLTLREQAAWLTQTQALPVRVAEPLIQLWRTAEPIRFAGQPPTVAEARAAYQATAALLGGPK